MKVLFQIKTAVKVPPIRFLPVNCLLEPGKNTAFILNRNFTNLSDEYAHYSLS